MEQITLQFLSLWLIVAGLGSLAAILRPPQSRGALHASVFYHQAFVELATANLNLVSGVIRDMLLTGSTTTPDNPDHEFVDDISADEGAHASYGRVTLGTKAMTDDDVNNRAEWSFADVVHATLNAAFGTVTAMASYLQVGGDDATPGNDILICLWDIADTAPDGSDFTLQPGSEGAVQFA